MAILPAVGALGQSTNSTNKKPARPAANKPIYHIILCLPVMSSFFIFDDLPLLACAFALMCSLHGDSHRRATLWKIFVLQGGGYAHIDSFARIVA